MNEYTIYFNNGASMKLIAKGIRWYRDAVVDMQFHVDDPSDDSEIVVAEFNSEHIAGYTVKEL